jgi:glutaminase
MRSPLHLAASEGHIKVVELLMKNNANASCTDRWDGTPIDDARRSGE